MDELTNFEKIRKLPWQLAGNAFNMIFCFSTVFGSVFILFLDELGLDKARIGFLLSLFPFCGLIALFVAPIIAKFGFKKTFVIFFGIRKLVVAFLLFTPLILKHFDIEITFLWVTAIILLFGLCRAISETAVFPWTQEIIPDSIRGKFTAINSIISMLISIATVAAAGYVIGHFENLNRFMFLIIGGVCAGFVSVWCFSFMPGGAPEKSEDGGHTHFRDMINSIYDTNFLLFIIGLAFATIGMVSLTSFVPLYMRHQIGITAGVVVWLDIGIYAGSLISSYLWGWAADRYGSKPVIICGLAMLCIYPVLLFFIPRDFTYSPHIAFAMTFFFGWASLAWGIGVGRYLFVTAVPTEKKTAYLAIYYAAMGLAGGVAPLIGGQILKLFNHLNTSFSIFKIDPYTPLFAMTLIFMLLAILVLGRINPDSSFTASKLVGMFFQGNPLTAFGSLFRYRYAGNEEVRVSITKHMGFSKNPLSNKELIEALEDPSFNVRYEAIIAIAQMKPTDELIDSLILVLGGIQPDLAIAAAWALGELGDRSSIYALRETLNSEYQLLRAASARALAKLGDVQSIPFILDRFRREQDHGLKIAYTSALGKMRSDIAIDEMFLLLAELKSEILREELTLNLARIIGSESEYIKIRRRIKLDPSTGIAQTLLNIKKKFANLPHDFQHLRNMIEFCAAAFGKDKFDQGVDDLIQLIRNLPMQDIPKPLNIVLKECIDKLQKFGGSRTEYILLSLHTLSSITQDMNNHT